MIKFLLSKHILDIVLGIYTYTYPEIDDIEINISIPRPHGFRVTEVVNGISLDMLYSDQNNQQNVDECRDSYVYVIKKINVDSYTVCELLRKKFRCGSCRILGLKDTQAVAYQVVILYGCKNPAKKTMFKLGKKHIEVFLWHCDTNVLHTGNKFLIELVVDRNSIEILTSRLNIVKKYKGVFLNFYGYQRFGSRKPVTHFLGKLLVKREFDRFVEKLCSYTFSLKSVDFVGEIEHKICHQYRNSYEDSLTLVKNLPKNYLILFVNAYQSYIFNVLLSKLWTNIVHSKNSFETALESMSNIYKYLPVVGSKIVLTQSDVAEIVREIMEVEDITFTDFILRELDLEIRGEFRESITYVKNLEWYLRNSRVDLSFMLDRGSYASIFVREITRTNPLLFT